MDDGLIAAGAGRCRCWWPGEHEDYVRYHDTEWGRPVDDEARLFEKICLEGFQSGLSWLTILRKRPRFREVFHGFEPAKVAAMGPSDVERLLGDAGIIRHRGKIESVLNNARRALELADAEGSLAAYFWRWEPATDERPERVVKSAIPGQTPTSKALSKDLKKRGWSYVGPTTCYAFMQAMGLVDDHLEGCFVRPEVAEARAAFVRP
ncbi:MAG: DNA-3-methyladenine glycosylase I [Sandaracinus sp.]|nr:DNA-3-methyladenine glycosylase I [Sandaracinus sp.]|tara:strand:- start:96 stop:716 length:621 start_codon:yes stop_codon:yes gene_type:complete